MKIRTLRLFHWHKTNILQRAEAKSVADTSIKSASAPFNAIGVPNALGIRVGSNDGLVDATDLAERILKKAYRLSCKLDWLKARIVVHAACLRSVCHTSGGD